jgi:hypothetical protein
MMKNNKKNMRERKVKRKKRVNKNNRIRIIRNPNSSLVVRKYLIQENLDNKCG